MSKYDGRTYSDATIEREAKAGGWVDIADSSVMAGNRRRWAADDAARARLERIAARPDYQPGDDLREDLK